MQLMFGDESITKYHDAVHYFRESLNIRARQAADHRSHDAGSGRPDGHQQMCNALRDCIRRIEGMDKPMQPESSRVDKRARTQVAWPALNAFALLGIDDDDDES